MRKLLVLDSWLSHILWFKNDRALWITWNNEVIEVHIKKINAVVNNDRAYILLLNNNTSCVIGCGQAGLKTHYF